MRRKTETCLLRINSLLKKLVGVSVCSAKGKNYFFSRFLVRSGWLDQLEKR